MDLPDIVNGFQAPAKRCQGTVAIFAHSPRIITDHSSHIERGPWTRADPSVPGKNSLANGGIKTTELKVS
jgi:hypothetical protein